MKDKKVLNTLDEILFENRNKEYGAYKLRQNYSSRLSKALFLGVAPILFFFLSSFWVAKNVMVEVEPDINTEHVLIDYHEVFPEIPELPKEKVAKPIATEVLETKVIPPDLITVEDTKAILEVDIPTNEELLNVVIAAKNQDGAKSNYDFHNVDEVEVPGDPETPPENKKRVIEQTFVRSELMPEFKGGTKEMYKWLGKHLRYPKNASRNGVDGRVILSFVIEKDGSITGIEVLKGIGFGCDEEAKRVIKKMPNWNAGQQNGKAVRVKYTLPLNFRITD